MKHQPLGTLATPGPGPSPAAPCSRGLDDPFAAFSGLSVSAAPAPFSPLALATNDFGAKWGTSKHERKRECPAPPNLGLEGLAAKLQRANARPVEAIPATNELILAAAHAPSGAPCLFHVKLLPTRAALVTVRSTDPAAAQAALDAATAAIP